MKTEGRKRRKATKKSDYHGLANHRMHQNTAVRTSDSGKDSNDEATQDIDGQRAYWESRTILFLKEIGEPHSGCAPESANNHDRQIYFQHLNMPSERPKSFGLG